MSTAEQSNWNACATKLQISLKSLPLGHGTICHYPLFLQKKNLRVTAEVNQINCLVWVFFFFIFLCLKRYVAKSRASSSQRLSHGATSWPLLNSAQMASADQLRHFWTTGSGEGAAAEPIERRFHYLRSWCSCGRPAAGSPPWDPGGRCCGCGSTPPPTGSARTSSGPRPRSAARASPGSLRPDSGEKAGGHFMWHRKQWRAVQITPWVTLYLVLSKLLIIAYY